MEILHALDEALLECGTNCLMAAFVMYDIFSRCDSILAFVINP